MEFMDLTDPEYAYMFGFVQMDGHLGGKPGGKGRLAVEISYRDAPLLHRFQQLTPYPSAIRTRRRRTNFADDHQSAVWTLCALEARRRMESLGLPYGSKSRLVEPPRVPFSEPDYARGVIDADGSVGVTRQGLPFISLATASMPIATFMCGYAEAVTGTPRTPGRNTRDAIVNVLWMKEAAVVLATHLYYPGCLALPRKVAAAGRVIGWERPATMARRGPRRPWRDDEDLLLLEVGTAEAAADRLGRSTASCSMRLWRLRTGRVKASTLAQPPAASAVSP